jgi:hypothetical protein
MHEREICSKAIVAKQRVLEDFWFKPYIGKFSGEEFVEKYVQKQHASQFAALNKQRTFINHQTKK